MSEHSTEATSKAQGAPGALLITQDEGCILGSGRDRFHFRAQGPMGPSFRQGAGAVWGPSFTWSRGAGWGHPSGWTDPIPTCSRALVSREASFSPSLSSTRVAYQVLTGLYVPVMCYRPVMFEVSKWRFYNSAFSFLLISWYPSKKIIFLITYGSYETHICVDKAWLSLVVFI